MIFLSSEDPSLKRRFMAQVHCQARAGSHIVTVNAYALKMFLHRKSLLSLEMRIAIIPARLIAKKHMHQF